MHILLASGCSLIISSLLFIVVLIFLSGPFAESDLLPRAVFHPLHHSHNTGPKTHSYLSYYSLSSICYSFIDSPDFSVSQAARYQSVISSDVFQALALIELFNAPNGRYKQDVYLLPKKMGKLSS